MLTDVDHSTSVWDDEAFGPVLAVRRVSSVDEGLALVNQSRFGLQAGIFTKDLAVAMCAHRELDVGGVVVGDVPSYRSDCLPYGWNKESGIGREGDCCGDGGLHGDTNPGAHRCAALIRVAGARWSGLRQCEM